MDEYGNELPAYGFFNNDDYKKVQPKDAPQLLYSLKANGPLKSKIHGNVYSRINSGMVRFLITEQEARASLLATKSGQKMKTEERVKRLMPHELTTKLFEEMNNDEHRIFYKHPELLGTLIENTEKDMTK